MVVSNDLEGDQRLHKVANSLLKNGWDPVLTGRRLPDSKPLSRPYQVRRVKLMFSKGAAFYACLNLRIFFHLLFIRADLFVANDLDTLLAVWLVSKVRRKPVIYDSHEYFTEVPELVNRPSIQRIWKFLERNIQPKLKFVMTVNESIADIFKNEYNNDVIVIKNLPVSTTNEPVPGQLPTGFTDNPVLIYQGAVNIGRGLEELLLAMKQLPDFKLLIVGWGDRLESLKKFVSEEGLMSRVHFTGRVPFESLAWYTSQANIGVSLEQDIGLSYRFSLPNKLFDYMHAGIPVIASDLPEIRKVVEDVGFGLLVADFSPLSLANSIRAFWQDRDRFDQCKNNALEKFSRYTWEQQEELLLTVYDKALRKT